MKEIFDFKVASLETVCGLKSVCICQKTIFLHSKFACCVNSIVGKTFQPRRSALWTRASSHEGGSVAMPTSFNYICLQFFFSNIKQHYDRNGKYPQTQSLKVTQIFCPHTGQTGCWLVRTIRFVMNRLQRELDFKIPVQISLCLRKVSRRIINFYDWVRSLAKPLLRAINSPSKCQGNSLIESRLFQHSVQQNERRLMRTVELRATFNRFNYMESSGRFQITITQHPNF